MNKLISVLTALDCEFVLRKIAVCSDDLHVKLSFIGEYERCVVYRVRIEEDTKKCIT